MSLFSAFPQESGVSPDNQFGSALGFQLREDSSVRWEGFYLEPQSSKIGPGISSSAPQLIGVFSSISSLEKVFPKPLSSIERLKISPAFIGNKDDIFQIEARSLKNNVFYGMYGYGLISKPFKWPMEILRERDLSLHELRILAWKSLTPKEIPRAKANGHLRPLPDVRIPLLPLSVSYELDPGASNPEIITWKWTPLQTAQRDPAGKDVTSAQPASASTALLFSRRESKLDPLRVEAFRVVEGDSPCAEEFIPTPCNVWVSRAMGKPFSAILLSVPETENHKSEEALIVIKFGLKGLKKRENKIVRYRIWLSNFSAKAKAQEKSEEKM